VDYFETVTTETEQTQSEQKQGQFVNASYAPSGLKNKEEHLLAGLISDGGVHLEPILERRNELSYSCILIPRFSDHYLTGDITLNLPVWMKEICISFGWRLESVTVRPGYMQWVVTVQTTVNPAHIMRLSRQQTSQKILNEFPRYKQQNLSGDFWAPGYSMLSGSEPQTPEEISNFIQVTRKQQGIF
jgi:REP element-mobilizing transposase RayT